MARVTPWRTGVAAGAGRETKPFALCRSPRILRPDGCVSLGLKRDVPATTHSSAPPVILRRLNSYRRVVTAGAAATAGAFQQEGLGASLRQQAQRLLVSPHDKEIWAVALPALVAMLLEPVMNALNAGLVGHVGTQHLSAVSLGSLAVSFVTFLFSFLVFLTVPEIAAAVVKKDADEVSCIAAKSLWIAVVCGFSSASVLYCAAGAIVGALNPPEAAVAAYAVEYIRVRSLGIPAALIGFVATGVFRGFKDTRTPLVGAVASAGVSLGLNMLLLYVLRMGVTGAAAATTAAQVVSAGLLLTALLRGGRVHARHLTRPPPLSAVLPTLKLGAVLGVRNIISFGMVLYASTLCIRMGSLYQASFEVIRQIWILTIQFFECLNVATQALCATYLGKEDVATARSLLDRLLALGSGVGLLAGVGVWAAQGPLVGFFTSDPLVVAQAVATLPLICALFPVDAAASIMDGSLLAAKQSNYMSVVQILGSVVQYGVLAYLAMTGNAATLAVWGALKILSFARLFGGVVRNYGSPKSAYLVPPSPTPHAAPAHASSSPAPAPAPAPAMTHAAPAAPAHAAAPAHTPSLPATATAAAFTQAPTEASAERSDAAPPAPSVAGTSGSAAESGEQQRTVLAVSAAEAPTAAGTSRPAGAAEDAVALSSFEEDVVAMACAACTSATDMHPEMLTLRRRASGDVGASSGAPAGSLGADAHGGAGDRRAPSGGDDGAVVSIRVDFGSRGGESSQSTKGGDGPVGLDGGSAWGASSGEGKGEDALAVPVGAVVGTAAATPLDKVVR